MYTEIQVSEFLIRARLKLGEISSELKDLISVGGDIQDLVDDATELRMFLNAVNSPFQTWNLIALYKRIEYFTDRFDLNTKPLYSKSWLNKFEPVKQIVIENPTMIQVPTGKGFLYIQSNTARLVDDDKLTLNNLP